MYIKIKNGTHFVNTLTYIENQKIYKLLRDIDKYNFWLIVKELSSNQGLTYLAFIRYLILIYNLFTLGT